MRNTRIITAIIAFVVTFVFSAGLVRILFGAPEVQTVYRYKPQCADRYASDIESFIWQDIRNGETQMERISVKSGFELKPSNEFFTQYADAVSEYVNKSSSMDDSQLPENLRTAWRKHMEAWQNYSDFLTEVKNSRKTLSDDEFRISEKRLDYEISQTWHEVIRLGRSYGADVY